MRVDEEPTQSPDRVNFSLKMLTMEWLRRWWWWVLGLLFLLTFLLLLGTTAHLFLEFCGFTLFLSLNSLLSFVLFLNFSLHLIRYLKHGVRLIR